MNRYFARAGFVLASVCLACFAQAQVPATIHQEGLVTDREGVPIAGPVDLGFSLWDAERGGNRIWQEVHRDVPLFEGYYSVLLGSREPLTPETVLQGRWLGLSIDGGADLAPRTPLASVPYAFTAASLAPGTAVRAGSVAIGDDLVIDQNGRWVGDPTGLRGPVGPAGPAGPPGERGPAGGDGSPDTPQQVRDKLLQVDGRGSGIDADRLDGFDSGQFVRTGAQLLALLRQVDGEGSGVDADRLDGIDSSELVRTAQQVVDLLRTVDGEGSGVDADRLDGLDSTQFVRTPEQVRDLLREVDGQGSGVDADRLDGLDSTQFLRADGNVRIAGDLTVAGRLTVEQPMAFRVFTGDNPPGPCNAANQGMIYFDTGERAFLGCNGAEWQVLSGDPGIGLGNVDVSGHFGDTRHTPNGWSDLPGRVFTVRKTRADSVIRLTYQDVLGYHMVGHSWGCRWRLTVDGGVPVRSFSSHTSTARGWRIQPMQLEWYLQGLAAGNHTYRIQVYRPSSNSASECLAGWPNNDTHNFFAVEEVDPGRVTIARNMADTRHTPNGWSDLPGRTLDVRKQRGDSLLRVSYVDNLGYHMVGHSWGCRWRLTRDGQPVGRPFSSHTSTARGWRIDPRVLTWVLDDLPQGNHRFRIQVYRPSSGSTSECLAGWPNNDTGNSFTAQEMDAGSVSLVRNLQDRRDTPNGWSNLPGREVRHQKSKAGTQVRVTYMDDIGYHMVGHGWGCRWRLTVNGNAVGRPINSHTSTRGGWRIDPMRMEWVIDGLAPGNHVYRMQLYRPSSNTTSQCLAGWPDGDTGNFFMVQEVE